jgi:hypothetical protein
VQRFNLLDCLVQFNHTVDGPDRQFQRDLRITLVWFDDRAVRLGGLLNWWCPAFVRDHISTVGLGSNLDRDGGGLTLVRNYISSVGFGGFLDGNLTLVRDHIGSIRFGGNLDRNLTFVRDHIGAVGFGGYLNWDSILTLSVPLDGGHHRPGERRSGNLANEEKREEESDDGRRREEHGC